MKKVLFTLCMLLSCVAIMAEKVYKIDQLTADVSTVGVLVAGDVSIESSGYTFSSGNNNCIKFSARTYTVKLPAAAKITKIEFYGYDNYSDKDAYIASCGGKTYAETDYVFPKKNPDAIYVTHTLDFSDNPLTGSFDFVTKVKQIGAQIKLYSDEYVDPKEEDDSQSLGKYTSPATGGTSPTGATKPFSYPTPASMMEKLDRGVVVLPDMSGKGNVITWRLFGTDNANTTFDVLRNGTVIKSDLDKVTNYKDASGAKTDTYSIRTKQNGQEVETSEAVAPWRRIYKKVQLDTPMDMRSLGCTYTPNDMSVGDVDGDGQYELIVKWNPTNSRDNSQAGITGSVFLDAYELDGTKLWRIDLGKNIRAGAHYTQFLVYDFDGDGKAEVVCKTAPGSKDGKGNYVSAAGDAKIQSVDNTQNDMNSNGHPTKGEEFLTIFNGMTGAAMHTIWFNPPRSGVAGATGSTSYGAWESVISKSTNYNRGERYNACVAYLDGPEKNPSIIMQRGYYTYAFFWAVDWDGTALKQRWLHYGNSETTWKTYDASNKEVASSATVTSGGKGKSSFGMGVHGISVGDVNGDGFDEIVMGAATIAHDGTLLCSTGMGHGDAIHLSDLCPDRPGLEIMMPHEESNSISSYGYDVHDATTGEIIYSANSSGDNGRGLAADVLPAYRGFEFWSSAESDVRACTNGTSRGTKRPSVNFRVYWDGDLSDELFDGHHKTTESDALKQNDWNGTCAAAIEKLKDTSSYATLLNLSGEAYGNGKTCNTTKSTPCLIADIFGDWREEIILWDGKDPSIINIYSSNVASTYRVPTLMHDHVYRMGVAWQNSSYNQPPHLGYYLPDMFDAKYGIYSSNYKGLPGDANADGVITMDDANMTVNQYLGNAPADINLKNADANADGVITMDDANYIVNKYLGN